jgi:hypothetical protein
MSFDEKGLLELDFTFKLEIFRQDGVEVRLVDATDPEICHGLTLPAAHTVVNYSLLSDGGVLLELSERRFQSLR